MKFGVSNPGHISRGAAYCQQGMPMDDVTCSGCQAAPGPHPSLGGSVTVKTAACFGKVGKQRTNDKISSWWWNFWVCWWSEIAQCSWDNHTSLNKEQKHVYKSGPVQSPSCNLAYMDHVGIYQFHHESRWISSWKFPRKNSWQSFTRRVPLLSYISTKKTTCGAQIVAPLQGFLLGSWLRASFNCTETKRSSRPTKVKSKTWTQSSELHWYQVGQNGMM